MTPDHAAEHRPARVDRGEDCTRNAARQRGRCIRCGACVKACPGRVLELDEQGPRATRAIRCWRCGICITACPTGAVNSFYPFTMDV
ncbi:4Fe-4S dicluster domain-containing protein [Mailhella sp.]|uniref:4Fe-4S dicluster domain-containing protein n=1 Tax=Mailhella sp. TaxID=1981029 RepID=UPI004064C5B1